MQLVKFTIESENEYEDFWLRCNLDLITIEEMLDFWDWWLYQL